MSQQAVTIYPSETHPKIKILQNIFAHNLLISCSYILQFSTEHGNDIAGLCAKLQNDNTTEMTIMDEFFVRLEFNINFRRDILNGESPQLIHYSLPSVIKR